MDCIHKRVQVFLQSFNTTAIEDVDSRSLTEFGGLQKKVERGEWSNLTPVWVDQIAPKEEGHRNSN